MKLTYAKQRYPYLMFNVVIVVKPTRRCCTPQKRHLFGVRERARVTGWVGHDDTLQVCLAQYYHGVYTRAKCIRDPGKSVGTLSEQAGDDYRGGLYIDAGGGGLLTRRINPEIGRPWDSGIYREPRCRR